ncbi:MAG: PLP-dependent aminotransferase family protein [Chromatiales bacterium]|nr:PLP-dependent aminotransferase family protein [Chromatiales bacterium]
MTAKRLAHLESSFIRDILALTQKPEIISFAGGLPDPQLFPSDDLATALSHLMQEEPSTIYQYGETQGIPALRHWIADNLSDHPQQPDNILITAGAQQGLDLIARCLLNPGDKVLIEAPSYLGAIQTFTASEAELISVEMTSEGPDLDKLETILAEQQITAFYCIPNFQNPTGISYSRKTRLALAELLQRHEVWVIEDDPYGALRYRGEALPSLQSLLPDQTLYLGSFSKIVSPGLRIGWVTAPEQLAAALSKMKQVTDLHTSTLSQQLLLHYLRQDKLMPHITKLRTVYGERLDAMQTALQDNLPKEISASSPEGGMFLWLELPQTIDSMELVYPAIEQGVAFVPGIAFYTGEGKASNCLRLNFTNTDTKGIEQGIVRLAQVLNRTA